MTKTENKEYLENDVKLKVCIIGVGNAGNRVIEKAHEGGYPTLAVNTSIKDLSDLVPSFIAGYEARGAGKDRDKAKSLFKVNGKKLFQLQSFIDMVSVSDIVYVTAATAGGTGSGIAPDLIYLLSSIYPSKQVIFYGILPKLSDSIVAQANTIKCMDEIVKLNIPYHLADLSHYEDIPNDVAYTRIGEHILKSINVVRGDYLHHSDSGMIDENDMRAIIRESGYMSVYTLDNITQTQTDKKTIQSLMIERIKHSPSVQIQRDEILKQLGVIINCPEEMMEDAKTGNYNELTKYIGMPLSIFENYSISQGSFGQFITIISGMNLPYSRILLCKQKIEEHEEKLKRVKTFDLSGDIDKISFLDGNRSYGESNDVDDKKKDSLIDDFFK